MAGKKTDDREARAARAAALRAELAGLSGGKGGKPGAGASPREITDAAARRAWEAAQRKNQRGKAKKKPE